jgi:hypothetical protein
MENLPAIYRARCTLDLGLVTALLFETLDLETLGFDVPETHC